MKTMFKVVFTILLCSIVANVYSQTAVTTVPTTPDTSFTIKPPKDTTIVFRLNKNKRVKFTVENIKVDTPGSFKKFISKFSLRQSMQSKNDKQEAAFINLVYPKDSVSSKNFSFAIAYNLLSDKSLATFQPFLEWQRNTLTTKKQNLFLAGLSYQTYLWDVISSGKSWVPVIIAKANYKHDAEKSTEGTQASLYLSPSFTGNGDYNFLPDAEFNKPWLRFFFNIYAGAEYENRAQVAVASQKGSVGRWFGRVTGSFYPLRKTLDGRLEIIPDYTYRRAFSNESTAEEKINHIWKLTFNLIVVTKEKSKFADVKIGFDHVNGVDPTTGFEKQQVNTLTLKIKI
jgi:hypothetical protein